jgi:ornithine cyclodeaminase/alanine dehydrogenase-like protein (mu-crystallin family)
VVASKVLEEGYYIQTPPFPLLDLIKAGRMTWDEVAEFGEVLNGRVGRRNRDDITVFHESQGGITDIALATSAFNEAVRRGLGQEFSL